MALGCDLFRNLIDRGRGGPPAGKLILPEDMSVVVFKGSRRPRSYVKKLILPTDSVFYVLLVNISLCFGPKTLSAKEPYMTNYLLRAVLFLQ